MPGYNALVDYDDDDTEDRYCCPICYCYMRSSVQTSCGHRFCGECFQRFNKNKTPIKCPLDNSFLSSTTGFFHDSAIDREILCLQVKCKNENCTWTNELSFFDQHSNQCEHEIISCFNLNCKFKSTRKIMFSHKLECKCKRQDWLEHFVRVGDDELANLQFDSMDTSEMREEVDALKSLFHASNITLLQLYNLYKLDTKLFGSILKFAGASEQLIQQLKDACQRRLEAWI